MTLLSERESRAGILEQLPLKYHGVLSSYEAFLAQLEAQSRVKSRVKSRGLLRNEELQLENDIETRLVKIVTAVREVAFVPRNASVLVTFPDTEERDIVYRYAFGTPELQSPYMNRVSVLSHKRFLITGEKSWKEDDDFGRGFADPSWRSMQGITERLADRIITKYLPSGAASVVLSLNQ